MSFNVLVIPEDFRKDQYILGPIIKELVKTFRPRARVQVCRDPLLRGLGEALKWSRIEEIIERYGKYDCFVLAVDRDGNEHRHERLSNLEQQAKERFGKDLLFAENAWQEVEVWALAGMTDLPTKWSWTDIRQHPDSKEAYFEPYAKSRGLEAAPFGGRLALGAEAAKNYPRVRQLCREDVEALELRLKAAFG